jgi:hypothetical protein
MITWKGCGRKWSRPNLRLCPQYLPGEIEENHAKSVRIAGLGAKI